MLWYLLGEILLGVAATLLIRRYLFFLVWVRGRSMRPTLQGGELLLGLRYRGRDIRRGDIVICRLPKRETGGRKTAGAKKLLIKRVIGLPGEELRIESGQVYIDGSALAEDYIRPTQFGNMDVRRLGPDEYFVMGDNRLASRDSRSFGPVQRSNILGRCTRTLFPLKKRGRIG